MPKISLKAVRTNANMTIEQWSKVLNVTKTTVCNWESGITEPNLSQCKTMSELSGIPIDYFFMPTKSK